MLARLTLAAILAAALAACGGAEPAGRTADDVLAAFVAAGLDGADARPMERDDYGMAPMACPGQTFPLTTTLDAESNGRLFTCESVADADKQAAYYEEMGKESAMLFSHVFRSAGGLMVLQMNGDLPQAAADQYAAILAAP